MTRIVAAVAAIILAVAVGLGFALYGVRADLAAAEAQVEALTAEVQTQKTLVAAGAAAAKARAAEQARNDKQRLKERNALTEALTRHPAWASEPVPADVANALGVQYRPKD